MKETLGQQVMRKLDEHEAGREVARIRQAAYEEGKRDGRAELREELRNLLGAISYEDLHDDD